MDSPSAPNKPGRPSKVSADLGRRIASLIVEGNSERAPAEACGLDAASFFNFMHLAKTGDMQYAEFARIITEAKEQRRTWKKPA